MGRKAGLDEHKVLRIVQILLNNPDGVWLRQLAKESGLSPSTVARYLETVLQPLVDENSLGAGKPLLRVVKLKPFVIERLEAGQTLGGILRIVRLVSKIN